MKLSEASICLTTVVSTDVGISTRPWLGLGLGLGFGFGFGFGFGLGHRVVGSLRLVASEKETFRTRRGPYLSRRERLRRLPICREGRSRSRRPARRRRLLRGRPRRRPPRRRPRRRGRNHGRTNALRKIPLAAHAVPHLQG